MCFLYLPVCLPSPVTCDVMCAGKEGGGVGENCAQKKGSLNVLTGDSEMRGNSCIFKKKGPG